MRTIATSTKTLAICASDVTDHLFSSYIRSSKLIEISYSRFHVRVVVDTASHETMACGGFHCVRNALTALNVLYVVSWISHGEVHAPINLCHFPACFRHTYWSRNIQPSCECCVQHHHNQRHRRMRSILVLPVAPRIAGGANTQPSSSLFRKQCIKSCSLHSSISFFAFPVYDYTLHIIRGAIQVSTHA